MGWYGRERRSWHLGHHGDVVESGPDGQRVLFSVSLAPASAVDPGDALEGLLARASAWEAMREALDRNADGGASAADVCAVGFEQQDRLVRDGQLGVRAAPEATASDDLAGSKGCYVPSGQHGYIRVHPDGTRHPLRYWRAGDGSAARSTTPTTNAARSILLDALGYHDDPVDPVGIADAVVGLYREFAQAIPNRVDMSDMSWEILVTDVQRWAVEQIPELADIIGPRDQRGWDPGG